MTMFIEMFLAVRVARGQGRNFENWPPDSWAKMVTRSVPVKLAGRSIDNYQVYIILVSNRKTSKGAPALTRPRPPNPRKNADMVAVTRSGQSKRSGPAKSRSKQAAGPSVGLVTRQEVADYIATLLEEMEQLARQNSLPQLAHRIEEAVQQARLDKARQE